MMEQSPNEEARHGRFHHRFTRRAGAALEPFATLAAVLGLAWKLLP